MKEEYIIILGIIWLVTVVGAAIYFSNLATRAFTFSLYENYKDYESLVNDTAVYPKGRYDQGIEMLYLALALNGEAGEVAEKIKKIARDKNGFDNMTDEDRKGIAKELGDVLWYTTTLGNEVGYSLNDIMEMNANKLIQRRANGTLHGSGDNREEV